GFFEYSTAINLRMLQKKTGMHRKQINSLLRKLAQLEVIELKLADQDSTVIFKVPREDDRTINPLVPYIEQYYLNKKDKINQMIGFVNNDRVCKMIQLLSYFGEDKADKCGQCSVCLARQSQEIPRHKDYQKIRTAITTYLRNSASNSNQLFAEL